MTLKLHGKPFELRPLTPSQAKLKTLLDTLPADEIFDAEALGKKTGMSANYVGDLLRPDIFSEYGQKVGRDKYYGNRKAIAELRKQVEK
jgi:hypothetical protein